MKTPLVAAVLASLVLQAAPADAQTAIAIGELRLGNLNCNQSPQYTFAGTAGQWIVIHVTETADFGGNCNGACCCYDVDLLVTSPSGAALGSVVTPTTNNVCGSSGLNRAVLGPFLLNETGDHLIRLKDKTNKGQGSFALFLQSSDLPQGNLAVASGSATLLPLATSGAVETLTFSAVQGDRILGLMSPLTGSVDPRLALYQPDGLALALPSSGLVDVIAPADGNYTLLAYSAVAEQGSYQVDLDVDSGTPPQVLYPGTGEDLTLSMGVNSTVGQFPDQQSATAGDLLTLELDSPQGAFLQAPYVMVAQFFPTGSPPIGFAPGLQFDFAGPSPPFILIDGLPGPLGTPVIPFGGLTQAYVIPPGLAGNSVMLQGISLSSAPANGGFASTHGHEVRFL